MTSDTDVKATDPAWHRALLYHDSTEYLDGIVRFIGASVTDDRPVLVAVPPGNGAVLRASLDGWSERVGMTDMIELGRNPSRIIPAVQEFIDEHHGRPVSFVGEPTWPGRTPAEVAEATRHEALINTAFAATGSQVLCPYDVARLPPAVIADAFRTHIELVGPGGHRTTSDQYAEPHRVWSDTSYLPPPAPGARQVTVDRDDLPALRALARETAQRAQLSQTKIDNLLLAVTELAANSIVHGAGAADVTIWDEQGQVMCQVSGTGTIEDPLVGRRQRSLDAPDGRGLWIVNQLCDLVQLQSSTSGTLVRVTV